MARLSIPKELVKSGLLRTGLHGVRSVLQRELNLKHLPISVDDKVKAQLANNGNDSYPYAWLVPSDAQAVKDQISTRAIQRFGLRVGTYGATRNTSRVGFIFPVKLGVELHYIDENADRILHMAETFLILSAINQLTFDIKFANQLVLNTRIEIPDNTTVPIADTGDTTKPGGIELTLPLIVHTYAGFFCDVSSVYDANPIIGYSVEGKDGGEDGFDPEYQNQIPQEFSTNDPRTP